MLNVMAWGSLGIWVALMLAHFVAYRRWYGRDKNRHWTWPLKSVLEAVFNTMLGALVLLAFGRGLLPGLGAIAGVLLFGVLWTLDHNPRIRAGVADGDNLLRLWTTYIASFLIYTGGAVLLLGTVGFSVSSPDSRLLAVAGAVALAHVGFNVFLYDLPGFATPRRSSGHRPLR